MLQAALARPIATYSSFDRRSRFIYSLIAVEGLLGAGLLVALGFSLSSPTLLTPPLWGAALLAAGLAARRIGKNALGGACETIALCYCQAAAALAMLIPLTAISAPLADASLANADRMLGFDWLQVAAQFKQDADWLSALKLVYRTTLWQPVLVLSILFATGRADRGWQMVTASAIALAITIAIYPFVPALGAAIHFGLAPSAYPGISIPWDFGPVIVSLKSGLRVIDPNVITGFVSFPSFHAASAVIFAWAARPTAFRWFFLALNIAVAFAALVVGAHYLVDILAGAMVGSMAIWGSRQLLGNAAVGTVYPASEA